MQNPILTPAAKQHTNGDYSLAEVSLANRNSGTLLETLCHDVTPVGAHYLLVHFDIPQVSDASVWQVELTGTVKQSVSVTLKDIIAKPTMASRGSRHRRLVRHATKTSARKSITNLTSA